MLLLPRQNPKCICISCCCCHGKIQSASAPAATTAKSKLLHSRLLQLDLVHGTVFPHERWEGIEVPIGNTTVPASVVVLLGTQQHSPLYSSHAIQSSFVERQSRTSIARPFSQRSIRRFPGSGTLASRTLPSPSSSSLLAHGEARRARGTPDPRTRTVRRGVDLVSLATEPPSPSPLAPTSRAHVLLRARTNHQLKSLEGQHIGISPCAAASNHCRWLPVPSWACKS